LIAIIAVISDCVFDKMSVVSDVRDVNSPVGSDCENENFISQNDKMAIITEKGINL